jgi:hypothetical protein
MRKLTFAGLTLLLVTAVLGARQAPYRTLDDKFAPPSFTDVAQWNARAAYLREHILASAGLLPMPPRTPLSPQIFGELKRNDYTVSKVYFQSLPGFLVTGNLYRPSGEGPFPAVLAPHGHWAYGRLENTTLNSVPGRAINLARQGFVVFTYDMVGYDDSRQLPHTFGGKREALWGLSLGGLQLWNSIRSLDFLQSLPYVQRDALAVTGESGGGTQTFLLAAVDERVKVAVPVNMISLHMQGGCLCENPPSLRLDTTNVEIAATIAPRPMLMISATGDWTANTLEAEYPAVRRIYSLLDAPDRVHAVRIQADHNYNRETREAMYAWLARWMKGAPADVQIRERSFTADSPADLLVFHQRALPPEALTAEQITENWINEARRQLAATDLQVRAKALRHALGYGEARPAAATRAAKSSVVLLAGDDPELEGELKRARFTVKKVAFTPFEAAAAAKVRHFETYNRTQAARRVADIVSALEADPGAAIVAGADAALAALLASAVVAPRIAVLDVGAFDTSKDADFVDRLYVPGLRRAGDLATAAASAGGAVVIHGAGERFVLEGVKVGRTKLTAKEIVARLRQRAS